MKSEQNCKPVCKPLTADNAKPWRRRPPPLLPYTKAHEAGKPLYFIGVCRIPLFTAFHVITLQNMIEGRLKGGLTCHHAQKR